jgi:hypothetical protein
MNIFNWIKQPKTYNYRELYFIKFGKISFGKENDLYIKKEWRGLGYKYITYKLINNIWIEQK